MPVRSGKEVREECAERLEKALNPFAPSLHPVLRGTAVDRIFGTHLLFHRVKACIRRPRRGHILDFVQCARRLRCHELRQQTKGGLRLAAVIPGNLEITLDTARRLASVSAIAVIPTTPSGCFGQTSSFASTHAVVLTYFSAERSVLKMILHLSAHGPGGFVPRGPLMLPFFQSTRKHLLGKKATAVPN